MKLPRLLAIDPGGTTGLSQIEFSTTREPRLVSVEQVQGGLKGFLKWYQGRQGGWDQVICEDFTLRAGVKFPDLSPTYIIGALEASEHWNPVKPIYQSPSQKPMCTDEVLKRMGFYTVGMPHGNDATRHGIIYLRKIKNMPTLLKGWPK